jgi:hypothetical protein
MIERNEAAAKAMARRLEEAHDDWCMENEARDPWHADSWKHVAETMLASMLDDATVERAAEALWDSANPFVRWVNLSEPLRVDPRTKARAVLAAAVEAKT